MSGLLRCRPGSVSRRGGGLVRAARGLNWIGLRIVGGVWRPDDHDDLQGLQLRRCELTGMTQRLSGSAAQRLGGTVEARPDPAEPLEPPPVSRRSKDPQGAGKGMAARGDFGSRHADYGRVAPQEWRGSRLPDEGCTCSSEAKGGDESLGTSPGRVGLIRLDLG